KAVFARALSSSASQRAAAQDGELPARSAVNFDAWRESRKDFIEDVRRALYASKLIAYSQGFYLIKSGSDEYHCDVEPRDLATIRRGGCIIRAKFLDRIRQAYDTNPQLPALILDPYFKNELSDLIDPWRRVVIAATKLGLPAPVFASSLSYYD